MCLRAGLDAMEENKYLASAGNQVAISSHPALSLILISAVMLWFMPSLGANKYAVAP